jgi:hypothetical protein
VQHFSRETPARLRATTHLEEEGELLAKVLHDLAAKQLRVCVEASLKAFPCCEDLGWAVWVRAHPARRADHGCCGLPSLRSVRKEAAALKSARGY